MTAYRQGFDPRDNGYMYPHILGSGHKIKILLVIEEHLRYNIIRSGGYFFLKSLQVGFQGRSLQVFFRITGHPYTKIRTVRLGNRFMKIFAIAHLANLSHKAFGMGMPPVVGVKYRSSFMASPRKAITLSIPR